MAMLSAFVAYMLLTNYGLGFAASPSPWPWPSPSPWAPFLEFAFLRRAKEPNLLGLIIITLGLEMMLYGLASWRWGADQKDFPFPVSDFEVHQLGGGRGDQRV